MEGHEIFDVFFDGIDEVAINSIFLLMTCGSNSMELLFRSSLHS